MTQAKLTQLQSDLATAVKPVCAQFRKVGELIEQINQRADFQLLAAWYKARETVRQDRITRRGK